MSESQRKITKYISTEVLSDCDSPSSSDKENDLPGSDWLKVDAQEDNFDYLEKFLKSENLTDKSLLEEYKRQLK